MQFVSGFPFFSQCFESDSCRHLPPKEKKLYTCSSSRLLGFFLAQLMVATLGVVMPKEEVDIGAQPQAKCKSRTGRNAHFSCSLPEGTEMASAKEKGFEDFLKKKISQPPS